MDGLEEPRETRIRRFLTCEAHDGELRFDRELLLSSSAPVLLWCGLLLGLAWSGSRLVVGGEGFTLAILIPPFVTFACDVLTGSFDPRHKRSLLMQGYLERLRHTSILAGIFVVLWLQKEDRVSDARLLLVPLGAALYVLPVGPWLRTRLVPPARSHRLLRLTGVHALYLGLLALALDLHHALQRSIVAEQWMLVIAGSVSALTLPLILASWDVARLTPEEAAAAARKRAASEREIDADGLLGAALAGFPDLHPERSVGLFILNGAWVLLVLVTFELASLAT